MRTKDERLDFIGVLLSIIHTIMYFFSPPGDMFLDEDLYYAPSDDYPDDDWLLYGPDEDFEEDYW